MSKKRMRRPAAVPPSAAQEYPESRPWARRVPVAPAAHPDRVAGNPGGEALPERGRVVLLALSFLCPLEV